jgi:hypothetical protein
MRQRPSKVQHLSATIETNASQALLMGGRHVQKAWTILCVGPHYQESSLRGGPQLMSQA